MSVMINSAHSNPFKGSKGLSEIRIEDVLLFIAYIHVFKSIATPSSVSRKKCPGASASWSKPEALKTFMMVLVVESYG